MHEGEEPAPTGSLAVLAEREGVALEPRVESELEKAVGEPWVPRDRVQARWPVDPHHAGATTIDQRRDATPSPEHEEDVVRLEVETEPRISTRHDSRGLDRPPAGVRELVLIE